MRKLYKAKWLILLIFICLFTFLGRVIDSFSVSQLTVAVIIGIDRNESGYSVTAQTVSASSQSSGQSNVTYVTVTSEGKTVSDAISKLSKKAGGFLSLAHCNVVVMSENALLKNPDAVLLSLVNSHMLPLNAVIISTLDSPAETIKAKIPTGSSASLYLQGLTLTEEKNSITKNKINEFLTDYTSKSASSLFALSTTEEVSDEDIISQSPAEGASTLNLDSNLAVTADGKSLVLDGEASKGAILIRSKLKYVPFTLEFKGLPLTYEILKSECDLKCENKKASAKLKVSAAIEEVHSEKFSEYLLDSDFKIDLKAEIEKQLKEYMQNAFEISKENDVDFLMIKNKAYQKEGLNFVDKNFLSSISFSPSVELKLEMS